MQDVGGRGGGEQVEYKAGSRNGMFYERDIRNVWGNVATHSSIR